MLNGVSIRDLNRSDRSDALAVLQVVYPDSQAIYDEFLEHFDAAENAHPGAYIVHYIGIFEGQSLVGIAGYAMSSLTWQCWELSWASVRPEYQGKCLGKLLIEARFERILAAAKTEKVYVLINTKPSSLYKDMGFDELFLTAGNNKFVLYKCIR